VSFAVDLTPIRGLGDIAAIERTPLEERIGDWDINHWIRSGLRAAPEKPALYYLEDADPDVAPQIVLYRDLARRIAQAANLFHRMGVRAGDPVFYVLPTVPQLYVVQMAALARGTACSINWMLRPHQLAELVRAAGAKLIVALGPTPGYEIWENVAAMQRDLPQPVPVLSVQGPGGQMLPESDLDILSAREPAAPVFEAHYGPDDVAAYIHSGGTTGSPKLVKLTHRGFVYKCWASTVCLAHGARDVIFADYPMFHIAGFIGRGLLPILHGNSIVIPTPLGARNKKFVQNYWRLVGKFGITIFSGVPTTLAVLAKTPVGGADLKSLRPTASTGSAALPVSVAEEIERKIGVRLLMTYGSTEFCQNVTQTPRDGETRFGSAGIHLPYTQVKAVKLDRWGGVERECAPGDVGAIIVKSPGNTPGYVDARLNEGFLLPDGWINAGDLGRIDAEGYLWLTGRAKDVIIRGGHNIDPAVIEETLLKHEAVFLAAAVAKPDAYAGELPVAYVQLAAGAKVSAESLRDFCRAHISERAATPAEIHILDELPLTDVRKPAKTELRYDAARRAFEAALSGLDAKLAITVGPDEARGTIVTIRVADAPSGIERRIAEVMSAYTMPYRLVHG
jgi:fatty-acyl-CoA synthase